MVKWALRGAASFPRIFTSCRCASTSSYNWMTGIVRPWEHPRMQQHIDAENRLTDRYFGRNAKLRASLLRQLERVATDTPDLHGERIGDLGLGCCFVTRFAQGNTFISRRALQGGTSLYCAVAALLTVRRKFFWTKTEWRSTRSTCISPW